VTDAAFVTARLAGSHDRASFTCGADPLDRYFRQQASQDVKRRIASCFVLTETATGAIAGYFTLAATYILLPELPAAVTAKLPRYPAVPAALIGRMAIATPFQGRKLGSVLLADALGRTVSADLATFALVVDPKDENARRFYEHHGFTGLKTTGERMFIPIEAALRASRSGSP
jgi:ribosomal protein S18 acetylase RimI-like enzyme